MVGEKGQRRGVKDGGGEGGSGQRRGVKDAGGEGDSGQRRVVNHNLNTTMGQTTQDPPTQQTPPPPSSPQNPPIPLTVRMKPNGAAAHVGICTDGAKAMTGRHSAVVTRVPAVAPDTT
ncbi:unnamed protein product [Oncorhynchus mykiss]|uniref:Uncharacterized protein n=1 Tax=Oncorhynchus mykiss TaxID=8022 RepID=A0A060YQE5_ONCMY|nr:unnamed protein product [Oncorhynchus mykiss]